MHNKHDPEKERKLILLAQNKIESGKYKVFGASARAVKREVFPELVDKGVTEDERCLVVVNGDGETIVLTVEAQNLLRKILNDTEWKQPFAPNK